MSGLFQEFWRCLQVVIGVRQVSVPQVRAQCEHLVCDLLFSATAGFQGADGERMPEIMKDTVLESQARRASRSNALVPKNVATTVG